MPLAGIEWQAMRLLLDPLSQSFGATFNVQKTKQWIVAASSAVRRRIAEELKGKLLCLKIDSASRHGRHILGINVQFREKSAVIIRTLGEYDFN